VAAILGIWIPNVASAQPETCSLVVKVFSYNALETKKHGVRDAEVLLTGKKVDLKRNAESATQAFRFDELRSGEYQLKVKRNGYIDRKKTVDLKCKYGHSGIVRRNVYIWKERSYTSDGSELVADDNENSKGSEADQGVVSNSDSSVKTKIFGGVKIRVLIDEDGNVEDATAVGGKSELFEKAVKAARNALFRPTLISGEPVKVSGIITYNFVP
jgi:hypothetical protein